MTNERLRSLDWLRGGALVLTLFFHASIYNFANIHKIDFSDPPLLIVLMSFMALWGGVFILYSGIFAGRMAALRRDEGGRPPALGPLLAAFGVYLAVHWLLTVFLGRWNVDFVNNLPNRTFVAASIRSGRPSLPPLDTLADGSSLSTIAFNLLVVGLVLRSILSGGRRERKTRNYLALIIPGLLILGLSFLRVYWHPVFARAVEAGNLLVALPLSFFLSNPYPLLPYLSYALFGAAIGLMIADGRKDLLRRAVMPLGALLLGAGITGMMGQEKSISQADWFWYFKTIFECGVFILFSAGVYLGLEGRKAPRFLFAWLEPFSRASLTVYLLEVLLSELLRLAWTPLFPGWDQTINGCLAFGAVCVALWALLLQLWRLAGYRFGFEWLWVRLFRKLGKESGKLEG